MYVWSCDLQLSILSTGAYASTPDGIFRVLTAWRFFQDVSGCVLLLADA